VRSHEEYNYSGLQSHLQGKDTLVPNKRQNENLVDPNHDAIVNKKIRYMLE
jgi:hypothetical protein